jgi:chorismate synthase
MPGSTFGASFRVTSFGESHGPALGCVVDGCPPGFVLDRDAIQAALDRRRPGQSALVSQRKEVDCVEVLSGLHPDGRTLGTPIALLIRNVDAKPAAYEPLRDVYRPSHGDYTFDARFGLRAEDGGGRASARETAARVAAGAIAAQWLRTRFGVEVVAWVDQVGDHTIPPGAIDEAAVCAAEIDASPTRCPDAETAARIESSIAAARGEGDTLGGCVRCVARSVPAGWGDPVFDKLEADLGKAMLSIPAARGFEIGSGFGAASLRGSAHNDAFEPGTHPLRTITNHSGGIQAGISNGMPIRFRVAFKPVATLLREQPSVNRRGEAVTIHPRGRHDPCVLPRAVLIVEAMTWLTLADHALRTLALDRR